MKKTVLYKTTKNPLLNVTNIQSTENEQFIEKSNKYNFFNISSPSTIMIFFNLKFVKAINDMIYYSYGCKYQ